MMELTTRIGTAKATFRDKHGERHCPSKSPARPARLSATDGSAATSATAGSSAMRRRTSPRSRSPSCSATTRAWRIKRDLRGPPHWSPSMSPASAGHGSSRMRRVQAAEATRPRRRRWHRAPARCHVLQSVEFADRKARRPGGAVIAVVALHTAYLDCASFEGLRPAVHAALPMALDRRGAIAAGQRRWSIATPTCRGGAFSTASTGGLRSCTRWASDRGAWVGLMLGNVPDFVILSLALSKIDAVVVPLDPTTGSRELEMVLEAAPLRALITRPRGGEGAHARRGLPVADDEPAVRERPGPPAGATVEVLPENRRRLQGTLLTCSLYKRAPAPESRGGRARRPVVPFTATVGGDPQGRRRERANLQAPAAAAIGKSLDVTGDGPRAVRDAAAPRLRLRLRAPARARPRHDAVPRGRDLGRSASPSCSAITTSTSSPAPPRCTARWRACRPSSR